MLQQIAYCIFVDNCDIEKTCKVTKWSQTQTAENGPKSPQKSAPSPPKLSKMDPKAPKTGL